MVHAHDQLGSGAIVALMYHAQIGPQSPVAGQDPHYSVSMSAFAKQLDLLGESGGAGCARDWLESDLGAAALLTFDDGHLSNYTLAFPALAERGMRADFFVNPDRVGSHGFAGWSQLREMSDAGMSIQSHGWDHTYFTALGTDALRNDLTRSRQAIEQRIGRSVSLLAPPGGRAPPRLVDLAHECGYRNVLGSRPGRCRIGTAGMLPRMAITTAMDVDTLAGWLDGRGIARAQLRYAALGIAKRVMGDRGYETLRGSVLGKLRGPA